MLALADNFIYSGVISEIYKVTNQINKSLFMITQQHKLTIRRMKQAGLELTWVTLSHSRDSAGNTDLHLHLRGYWKVACLHNIQDLKRNSVTHGSLPKQFKINKTIYNMDIWYLHQGGSSPPTPRLSWRTPLWTGLWCPVASRSTLM